MKVLFLNYEYPPLGGGAANATRYILREFSRMPGVEAHLVTSGMGKEYEKEHIGGSVWVHRLPIGKDPGKIHSQSVRDLIVYSAKAWWFSSWIIRTAKREGNPFDRTIAFFGIPCGALALWFKWRFGIPYVVSLRGSDVPGYSEKYDRLYLFLAPFVRLVWKKALAVVPNSRGLAELAGKTAPRQAFEIIPNGVDTEEFRPDPARERDGYFRILAVSRLTPRKGIRFLIRAMSILSPSVIASEARQSSEKGKGLDRHASGEDVGARDDRYSKLELWIAGDGEEKAELEVLAKECGVSDKVKFFGAVPHEHLGRYYGLADVFCLPSQNEGMSNTVLEALAAGLPIVATVTGGTEELIRDGENGLFVVQRSPEDLAEKLGKLLADESLRVRMGEAGRKRAEEMNWESVAGQFLELCSRKKAQILEHKDPNKTQTTKLKTDRSE
ncbi:MAG: glycosyltransferase family 4 protein [Candidatus Moranbacteria bacterium]|nr:glycosyltransferase family 4 protein [Candidatus Moranbacteria bacterium]